MSMNDLELGRRLRVLQPAPPDWVRAAQELPFVQDEVAEILARAAADSAFGEALRSDPGEALADAGYELSPDVVAHMHRRLHRRPGAES
jgi:hypothetical protein